MLHSFSRELELPNRLETDYLRILYYEFPSKYSATYNTYEYARLCTILEGEKNISTDKINTITYDKNQILLMPSKSYIDMKIDVPTKAIVYELNDSLIKKVCDNISEDYKINHELLLKDQFLCKPKNLEISDILDKICKTYICPKKGQEYLLDLYAQELVYHLYQIKGVNQILTVETKNPINIAIQYMKREYKSQINIKQLAYDLHMSESNFSQHFKKVTGVSPKEYLTTIKMEKAKDIILKESITDTAYDLGYESISNFISNFRNKYGITPKQYKKTCMSQTYKSQTYVSQNDMSQNDIPQL